MDIYTHSLKSHSNTWIGSLQLLGWLFFHPSAWKHHLQSMDANLRADFCLAEVNWSNRPSPAFCRFLLQGYVILPLFVGVSVLFCLWTLGVSGTDIVFGVAVGLSACIAGSLTGGVVVGVAVSLASSVISGVVVGVLFGAVVGTAKLSALGWGLGSAAVGVLQSFIHPVSLVGMNISNVAASVAVSVSKRDGRLRSSSSGGRPVGDHRIPLNQKIGGAILGLTISLVTLVIVAKAADNFVQRGGASPGNFSIGFTTLVALGLVMGALYGVAAGWRTQRWRLALPLCMGLGTLAGTVVGWGLGVESTWVRGIAIGGGNAALLTTLFALPYVLIEQIAGTAIAAIVGTVGSGGVYIIFASVIGETPFWLTLPLSALCISLGLTMAQWRPALFYPLQVVWNAIIYRVETQRRNQSPSLLRWNAAFWDEFQYLPLVGLDRHLLWVMEHNLEEGEQAIATLGPTPQRWAVQSVQLEQDIRYLANCDTIIALGKAYQKLVESAEPAFLQDFRHISLDVSAALLQRSSYHQRLALSVVGQRLQEMGRCLTQSRDRIAPRLYPMTQRWQRIVCEHIDELLAITEQQQEIASPYVIGVPLTEQQAIFVGRADISEQIERLLRNDLSPPILLYGQRRMGKTSLLNHLGRLLSQSIVPLFIDLQGPPTQASDQVGFLYNLARAMSTAAKQSRGLTFPGLSRETLSTDPFTLFHEWLDRVEEALGDRRALLALDEFEALASALEQKRFEAIPILSLLRNLIQHRPRFKVLLAGTHTLEAFHQWASYLINIQVIHISYLSSAEAIQLIEHPVPDFTLRYYPEAVQRILVLTRCHPFLVQLLCAEVVALKNEQNVAKRRWATVADVEAAVPTALQSASFFFADIERNQVSPLGAQILRHIARHEPSPGDLTAVFGPEAALKLNELRQQGLIETLGGRDRFHVELLGHWFGQCRSK